MKILLLIITTFAATCLSVFAASDLKETVQPWPTRLSDQGSFSWKTAIESESPSERRGPHHWTL